MNSFLIFFLFQGRTESILLRQTLSKTELELNEHEDSDSETTSIVVVSSSNPDSLLSQVPGRMIDTLKMKIINKNYLASIQCDLDKKCVGSL